jgi:hypothetical protein
VKKEKSKIKHILGLKHINIPIQLDLWGNEVIFKGKGQTTIYGCKHNTPNMKLRVILI